MRKPRRGCAREFQIVADDGFVQRLHAVVQVCPRRHGLGSPNGHLRAFVGMVVGINRRIVAEQNVKVAMAPVGEARDGLLSERLLEAAHQVFVSSQDG